MFNQTDKIASRHLGKKSANSETYSKDLLVAIPRIENRKQYNISNKDLPFEGYDIWHGYEFSTLTKNGIPITRVLKLKYNCNSEFLVESKSLKLYLNSFNMSRFGNSIEEALNISQSLIKKDLSEILATDVDVNFLDNNAARIEIFNEFENIFNYINEENIKIEHFKEAPELLKTTEDIKKEYFLTFDSLRSNCRVTHQPDFGDVFIYYKSDKHIIESSLVKYLSSFRSEYHFHEECVEMIYKRISDVLNPNDELFISALYTRRGGIDICPVRWSSNISRDFASNLLDINSLARSGIKQ